MTASNLSAADHAAYTANLRKFYLFRFLVDFQLWLPIWVIYLKEERGLSLTQITALDAPFWIVLVLMEVPTGAIADRYGRKISLIGGAAANSVAIFVFGVAGTFPLLLASYLVWGVALTLYSGADSAFFFDSLKALGRESEFQKLWGRARSVQAAGSLLGVLLGAPVAAATNLWFPVIVGGVFLSAACAVSFTFKEPPRLAEGEHPLSYVAGVKQAASIAYGRPAIRYMMLLAAVVMAAGAAMSILSQPFLDSHGVGVGNLGWYLLPGSVGAIVAAMFAYRVAEAVGVRRIIAAMPLLVMVSAVGLGTWDSLGAVVFLPVSAVIMAMVFPVVANYLNQRIPSSSRATILSFYQLNFSLMIAALEPSLGAIGEHSGLPAAFRIAAILLAVVSAPLLALWLRASRHETLESQAADERLLPAIAPGEP